MQQKLGEATHAHAHAHTGLSCGVREHSEVHGVIASIQHPCEHLLCTRHCAWICHQEDEDLVTALQGAHSLHRTEKGHAGLTDTSQAVAGGDNFT